jgi:hypothetical protein
VHLGWIRECFTDQREQGIQLGQDVLQCDGLEFALAGQGTRKGGENHLDVFSAERQAVQVASPIKIFDARYPAGIGLRFQITPRRQLGERKLYLVERRNRARPRSLELYLVGPQLQSKLTLRSGKRIHDRAILRGLIGANMAKKIASGHGKTIHMLGRRQSRTPVDYSAIYVGGSNLRCFLGA